MRPPEKHDDELQKKETRERQKYVLLGGVIGVIILVYVFSIYFKPIPDPFLLRKCYITDTANFTVPLSFRPTQQFIDERNYVYGLMDKGTINDTQAEEMLNTLDKSRFIMDWHLVNKTNQFYIITNYNTTLVKDIQLVLNGTEILCSVVDGG